METELELMRRTNKTRRVAATVVEKSWQDMITMTAGTVIHLPDDPASLAEEGISVYVPVPGMRVKGICSVRILREVPCGVHVRGFY
jgi:hypothetical protein